MAAAPAPPGSAGPVGSPAPAPGAEPRVPLPRARAGTHLLSCHLQALLPSLLLHVHVQSGHDVNSHQLGTETTTDSLCRQGSPAAAGQASPPWLFTHTQSLPFSGTGPASPVWPMETTTHRHIQIPHPWAYAGKSPKDLHRSWRHSLVCETSQTRTESTFPWFFKYSL